MTTTYLSIFNRLCYEMIMLTSYQQRIVVLLINTLAIVFVTLQFFIFTDIVMASTQTDVVLSSRDVAFNLGTITLHTVGFLGLRLLMMIADNPISNSPCERLGYTKWSAATFPCFLVMLASVLNLLANILNLFINTLSIDAGTYLVILSSMYASIVCASPFIIHLMTQHNPSLNLSSFPFKCFFVTQEPAYSFISESNFLAYVATGKLPTGNKTHISLRFMLNLHIFAQTHKINDTTRTYQALTKDSCGKQMYWLTLSYLLTNQWAQAGRTIQHSSTEPGSYLTTKHKWFFALHSLPENKRFLELTPEIRKIKSDDEQRNNLAYFMQTWNLMPYYFINHSEPDIRLQAMKYMADNKSPLVF